MRTTRSTSPSPIPSYASGWIKPSQPCSTSFDQSAGVMPSGVSINVRTTVDGNSFSKNFRAVLRSSSCSSLNPKFMACSFFLTFRKTEHALADDVALDLRRAALDRVGSRPEERVLPQSVGHGPGGAAHDLGVRAFDLHGQLLQPLVPFHPHHLAGRGLGPRQLTFQQ